MLSNAPFSNDEQQKELVTVVGNLCTPSDILAQNVMLNKADIHDIVAITNAGSYAFSLSPLLFSSHSIPEQHLWDPANPPQNR